MAELLRTDRLLVRDWSVADAEAALKIYGHDDVSRWMYELERIPDTATMRMALQSWTAEQSTMAPGTGRWAVVLLDGGALVGGITLLPMPVPEADVENGYQLAPEYWGRSYITEAARALARWAFQQHSLVELFALVAPNNVRAAATARRIGMEWVGESDKYHRRHLQVFRLRPDDLISAGNPRRLAP
ncbi:MAG TPA: GNAT family N-acetyltransferase [Pseudonocardiaceae bacterium]|nr:GNAT family N-acetyltransferase [Pseudonocardiaceae bacterium]